MSKNNCLVLLVVALLLSIFVGQETGLAQSSLARQLTVSDVEKVTGLKGIKLIPKDINKMMLDFVQQDGTLLLSANSLDLPTFETAKGENPYEVKFVGSEAFEGPPGSVEHDTLIFRSWNRAAVLSSALDPKTTKPLVSEEQLGELAKIIVSRMGKILIVPEKRGFWDPVEMSNLLDRTLPLPAAEARVMAEKFRQLAAVFAREKALNPPMGFAVFPRALFGPSGWEASGRPGPLPGYLYITLIGYYEECNPKCSVGLGTAVEPLTSIVVSTNSIGAIDCDPRPAWQDEQGPVFVEPRMIGQVAGLPEYASCPAKSVIVLTKIKRPLWLPVSQERFIRHHIDIWRPKLAEVQKGLPPSPYQNWLAEKDERVKAMEIGYRAMRTQDPKAAEAFRAESAKVEADVTAKLKAEEPEHASNYFKNLHFLEGQVAALEAELAALSPAAKAAPAYVSPDARGSGLAEAGTRGAYLLVTPNRDFFDPARSKTSIQLLVVDFGFQTAESLRDWIHRDNDTTAILRLQLKQDILRDVDWTLLASFLDEDSRGSQAGYPDGMRQTRRK